MGITKQSILITGGYGNLGSWLTHFFCSQGYDVTLLTRKERKLEFEANFNTIICDISNAEDCKDKLQKHYDVIIHTASMNDNFVDNYAFDALKVNALGTRNILDAVKEQPPSHFIYFSTFHVYGSYSGKLTEESALTPMNDYGTTHLFAEYYVKQFHKTHNIPFSIIRLSNSYGCPKDYNSSKWYLILNDLSKMAFEKKKIVLKGNGKGSRDFIWMGDVCDVIHQLSDKKAPNTVFNLSSGVTYSLLDVANSVQVAFKEKYGELIPIEINTNDTSTPKNPVEIISDKIKKIIPFEVKSHFKNEAIEIFNFLEKR